MAYTTIDDPSAYFQTKIYTDGDATTNDTTSQTFDGNSDLQPDLMWFKSRNVTGNHGWMDTSRGKDGGTSFKTLFVTDAAERTSSSGYDLTSMNSDGFSYGRPNQLDWAHDTPANNVVWAWKANGGSRTTNTESGNNPAGGYQANTTAGFSIVDYTGTGAVGTMAHGLGAVPKMIIVKNRGRVKDWCVYHASIEETHKLELNLTSVKSDDNAVWNDTAPTSSVFTVGPSDERTNANDDTYVAYCFAEKQGYSKFGSYTGNGNADGAFVYLGFKPAFVMIKSSSKASQSWHMLTGKIATGTNSNPLTDAVDANQSIAERGTFTTDFLSNGFKIRHVSGGTGSSGETYIYMAFAESPFVSSEGVPTTAR